MIEKRWKKAVCVIYLMSDSNKRGIKWGMGSQSDVVDLEIVTILERMFELTRLN